MDIYDSSSALVGFCPNPEPVKKGRRLSKRDARAKKRTNHAYVFDALKRNPEAYGVKKKSNVEKRVEKDLGKGRDRDIKGLQRAVSAITMDPKTNSVPNSEFDTTEFLCGKDWQACCGVTNRQQTGEHIRVKKGTEDTYPANPAFYVFLLNANTDDPLIKYGKTDRFRARLAGYMSTAESVRIMHLRIWPLEMKNVLTTHTAEQVRHMADLRKQPGWPEHMLEHLVKTRLKTAIRDRSDSMNLQRLSGKGVNKKSIYKVDDIMDSTEEKNSVVGGNFSEFHHYSKPVAKAIEEIVRLAEYDMEKYPPWPVSARIGPRRGDDDTQERRGSITTSKYPQLKGQRHKVQKVD